MKLYDLNTEIKIVENLVENYAIEHDGDITDFAFEKILFELKEEKDEKLLSLATWYKNIDSDATAISDEIKKLSARKKSIDNMAERLKSYIALNLEQGKKLANSKSAISWRKSESVNVICDVSLLDDNYKRTKIIVEADKTALKTAIKSGVVIDGVILAENFNLQIK